MNEKILQFWRCRVENKNKEWCETPNVIREARMMGKWLLGECETRWLALLFGNVGAGKTTLMEATIAATSPPKIWHQEFATEFALKVTMDLEEILKVSNFPLLALDDIGIEPTNVQNYGNVFMPVANVLEARYRNRKKTIITTNLSFEEIGEKYGNRVKSRLQEMAYPICFSNDDFRRIGPYNSK